MLSKVTFLVSSLFLLSAITGCSTPYDLKRTKPRISYVSTRPAKDVMKCIRDSWREHQTTIFEEKTSKGWMIRHNDVLPAATVAIVMVEEIDSEVHVNYYNRTNRIKDHRLEEKIVDCKE